MRLRPRTQLTTFGGTLNQLSTIAGDAVVDTTVIGSFAMPDSNHRGQGYGAGALYFAARACQARGYRLLLVGGAATNAIGFYEHLGLVRLAPQGFARNRSVAGASGPGTQASAGNGS